ncbi:MarR family winged helix-turn-helix transcriptional regulator [Rhizobium sp. C4]|uniref:MarR family winged helix-turn-helix transcriptional regulator n=1 Tax=Rhizobium sp. C4 TaxID=1349800 RepID=UPI001E3910F1|nr:MarR family transcriptional regulator [Rhizobium sp. C4]MCD2173912.1 MarR family transcriptional regulator [Rhizobium sp. C4]
MSERNSPNKHRPDMHEHILNLIGQWQDATQAFDEAVGNKLGLITAEHRCLKALMDGPKTAGALAQASGLTPAAATSMIDRLEKRGFVERQRDGADRRKVLVAMTKPASDTLGKFYTPIAADAAAMLAKFTPSDLSIIENFIEAALALQQAHVDRTVSEPLA